MRRNPRPWIVAAILVIAVGILISTIGKKDRVRTAEQTGKNDEFQQLLRNESETEYDEAAIARRARQAEINQKPFPSEGQHVGALHYRGMVRQYRDNSTCWCPTTLYRYTIGDSTYKLWISDTDTIIKVELYSVSPQPGKSASGSSGRKPTAPEFDVDAFRNPEDFYDWYIDDFIDFEEAEEYYYDHGGT